MNILFLLVLSSFSNSAFPMTKGERVSSQTEGRRSVGGSSGAAEARLSGDVANLLQNEAFLNYYHQMPEIPSSKLEHFKFRSRNVGGKKIASVTFKADPDRDRRSILVPDAEGLLQPRPFAPLRHHHKFLPLFEDETLFSLNRSSAVSKASPPLGDLTRDEVAEERTLKQLDNTLRNLQVLLEDEEKIYKKRQLSKEARDKNNGRREMRKKNKNKRKKKREKKKEKRKNKGEKKNKKKRKSRIKMQGQEACQYKILKRCTKTLGLLPKRNVQNMTEFEKCDQRKEFLECVETRRLKRPCKIRSVARGNLPNLRTWIKKLFWTSSSCLLNEALKRK